jgi:hypothetical protein
MFMGVLYFSEWFFYLLGMLLVIWGFQMTWEQVRVISFLAFRWGYSYLILYPLAIILLYTLYGLVIRPFWVMRLSDMPWRTYWGHSILKMAMNYYALFYFITGQVKSLMGQKARFIIGEKRWFRCSLWDIIRGMKWTIAVILIIAIGLIWNPVGRVIHFVWYFPLFLSPLIIYWIQNAPIEGDTNHLARTASTFSQPPETDVLGEGGRL